MHRILLAEDNPGDVLLFRAALQDCNVACELIVAEDGEKALKLLEDASQPGETARLDLIVLDVNLPRRSGQQVLQWVREKPAFASVPVVVLTSSASPADRTKAQHLGASLYLRKSSKLDDIFQVGNTIAALLGRNG